MARRWESLPTINQGWSPSKYTNQSACMQISIEWNCIYYCQLGHNSVLHCGGYGIGQAGCNLLEDLRDHIRTNLSTYHTRSIT